MTESRNNFHAGICSSFCNQCYNEVYICNRLTEIWSCICIQIMCLKYLQLCQNFFSYSQFNHVLVTAYPKEVGCQVSFSAILHSHTAVFALHHGLLLNKCMFSKMFFFLHCTQWFSCTLLLSFILTMSTMFWFENNLSVQ